MSPVAPDSQSSDLIELAGKVVVLTTALLPVAGFVARATAFEITFHDSGWAIPMAWSASLPDLAFTGLWSVCLAAPVFALLWLRRWASPRPGKTLRGPSLWLFGHWRVFIGVFAAAVIAIVLLGPFWPASLFPALLFAVTVFGFRLSRGGRVERFRDIWWVIVCLVLISALGNGAAGLLGGYVQTADYHFDTTAGSVVANGPYQAYGEANGFVYLQRCGTSDIYAVSETDVVSMRPPLQRPVRAGPSLLDVSLGATPEVGAYKC
jgi:hypothetical protein